MPSNLTIEVPHCISGKSKPCKETIFWNFRNGLSGCAKIRCVSSPVKHFGNSYAEVVGRTLQLTTTKAGKYNVLIFNTRKDHCAKECWTGVEYEQPEPAQE